MLPRPTLRTSVQSRKRVMVDKVPTKKLGDLLVPQTHLARWTRPRVCRVWGTPCGSAGGQVLPGGPWSLATYDKGASAPDLSGQRALGFCKGSGIQVPSCPGPLAPRGGVRLWFPVQLEVKGLSSAHSPAARLVALVCCLWKAAQDLGKRDGTLWSWSCGCAHTQMSPWKSPMPAL